MSSKDRYRPWRELPKVKVIQKHLDEFYRFMFERHSIWVRRFLKKEPPPWTKDPILQKYKFTNVYRELDRGTIWYNEHIAAEYHDVELIVHRDNDLDNAKMNLLWKTIVYRLLNRIETFEAIGGVPDLFQYDPAKFSASLYELKKAGKPVFTSAHLTLPTHDVGSSKICKYIEVLNYTITNIEDIYLVVKYSSSLREIHCRLMIIPCVGNFIAYEVVTDLAMVGAVPFTEDDWANPGPGCKVGISIIFPDRKYISFEDAIKKLRVEQEIHFERLGLKFPYLVVNGREKKLTLRAIEHSLCEFCKWWKMKHRSGKARMIFKPREGELYQGSLFGVK